MTTPDSRQPAQNAAEQKAAQNGATATPAQGGERGRFATVAKDSLGKAKQFVIDKAPQCVGAACVGAMVGGKVLSQSSEPHVQTIGVMTELAGAAGTVGLGVKYADTRAALAKTQAELGKKTTEADELADELETRRRISRAVKQTRQKTEEKMAQTEVDARKKVIDQTNEALDQAVGTHQRVQQISDANTSKTGVMDVLTGATQALNALRNGGKSN